VSAGELVTKLGRKLELKSACRSEAGLEVEWAREWDGTLARASVAALVAAWAGESAVSLARELGRAKSR